MSNMNETLRIAVSSLLNSVKYEDLNPTAKGTYRFIICSTLLREMEQDVGFWLAADKNREVFVKRLQRHHDQYMTYTGVGFVDISDAGASTVLSKTREILGIEEDQWGRAKIAYDTLGHSKQNPLPGAKIDV